jgi:preprotein translocase subunit SecA
VEGLRVSIGLEAYAQRDPLVQYKGRASEMFQQLLGDIRIGVISRLFTLRPRPQAAMSAENRGDGGPSSGTASDGGAPAGTVEEPDRAESGGQGGGKNKKKRKRH